MDHNVFAPPKSAEKVVSPKRAQGALRALAQIEKGLGGLALTLVALGLLGLALEPERLSSDAVVGVAAFCGLGAALLGGGIALGRGYTWPQYPLLFAVLLLGLLITIGSIV